MSPRGALDLGLHDWVCSRELNRTSACHVQAENCALQRSTSSKVGSGMLPCWTDKEQNWSSTYLHLHAPTEMVRLREGGLKSPSLNPGACEERRNLTVRREVSQRCV